MNTLDTSINIIKQNFDYLNQYGYTFQPIKIYNADDSDRIFAKLCLLNSNLKRELNFTIYPRDVFKIEVFITNSIIDESLDIKHYIEFKEDLPLQYSPPFILDKEHLSENLEQLMTRIKFIIESDLKDVIMNKEWITIPTYDPRDNY